MDLVVVALYGGRPAKFRPPVDVAKYDGNEFFPTAEDQLVSDTECDGGMGAPSRPDNGCWNISFVDELPAVTSGAKIRPGMPSCDCTSSDTAPNDLLAGMMQRVVAAINDA